MEFMLPCYYQMNIDKKKIKDYLVLLDRYHTNKLIFCKLIVI